MEYNAENAGEKRLEGNIKKDRSQRLISEDYG